jgi:hypothetical protein
MFDQAGAFFEWGCYCLERPLIRAGLNAVNEHKKQKSGLSGSNLELWGCPILCMFQPPLITDRFDFLHPGSQVSDLFQNLLFCKYPLLFQLG